MSFEDELEAFFEEVEDVIVDDSERHEADVDEPDKEEGDYDVNQSSSEPNPKRSRRIEEETSVRPLPVSEPITRKNIIASSAPIVHKVTVESRPNNLFLKGPFDTKQHHHHQHHPQQQQQQQQPMNSNYTPSYGNTIQTPNPLYSNQLPIMHQPHEHSHPSTTTVQGKVIKRSAAGQVWEDPSLADFPENDFRCFVGNLGKDVSDSKLASAFSGRYPSFVMARVVFDKTSKQSKGYGFVSFMDPADCAKALREMDKAWIGSRPIQMKLSDWKTRDLKEVQKKDKKNKKKKCL